LGRRFGFGKLFKQVSFYLLMPIAITTLVFACSPSIAGTTDVWSMLLHLIGITCGIVFAVIFRKKIKNYFDDILLER
jgi:membrane associated rhomboid family serine protease